MGRLAKFAVNDRQSGVRISGDEPFYLSRSQGWRSDSGGWIKQWGIVVVGALHPRRDRPHCSILRDFSFAARNRGIGNDVFRL